MEHEILFLIILFYFIVKNQQKSPPVNPPPVKDPPHSITPPAGFSSWWQETAVLRDHGSIENAPFGYKFGRLDYYFPEASNFVLNIATDYNYRIRIGDTKKESFFDSLKDVFKEFGPTKAGVKNDFKSNLSHLISDVKLGEETQPVLG